MTAQVMDILDYVAELSDRFPDMSDQDVLYSVEDYCDKLYTEDTGMGRIILYCYNTGDARDARDTAFRMYGISFA